MLPRSRKASKEKVVLLLLQMVVWLGFRFWFSQLSVYYECLWTNTTKYVVMYALTHTHTHIYIERERDKQTDRRGCDIGQTMHLLVTSLSLPMHCNKWYQN